MGRGALWGKTHHEEEELGEEAVGAVAAAAGAGAAEAARTHEGEHPLHPLELQQRLHWCRSASRGLALGLIRFPLRNSRGFVQAKITKKWRKRQGREINKGKTRQGLGLGLD